MYVCGITGGTSVLGKELISLYKNKIRFKKFLGDIKNSKHVNKWVKKNNFDFIIHLAAIVPTNIVEKNLIEARKVNVIGSLNLARSILESKKNIWFFYASTSHVYQFKNKKKKLTEKSKLNPYSNYGKTKLEAENLLISEFKKNKKINCLCIGRIFSFTNYNQKKSFLIPGLVEKIKKEKKKVELYNLNHFRDFLLLKDICLAIWILMKKKKSGIFNICSGEAVNLADIAKMICSKLKKDLKINNLKNFTYIVGNNIKLKKLGWVTTKKIDGIINDYLLKSN
jgi:nucleoside-diphosphate-sugar epimerase